MKTEKTIYVVIGGTSGIGAALVAQLSNNGNIVHLASRQTGLDISDEQAVAQYFETIGTLDHLVITAGSYAPAGKVVDVSISDAKAALDIKFWGSIHAAKHAARYMKPGGSITLTTGMLSRKVIPNTYVKTATNAALEAVTKVLAREQAPIRVNAISPGLTQSSAYQYLNEADQTALFEQAKNSLPVGKVATTDDIATAYTLVINNSFMTGAIVDVDGGALISLCRPKCITERTT